MEENDVSQSGETNEEEIAKEEIISESAIEETQPSPTAETPERKVPHPPAPKPAPKEDSRIVKALRRTLRWTVGVAIIFVAGILIMFYVRYIPIQKQLNDTRIELLEANQQIEDLLVLQDENSNLKDLLNEANLRRYLNTAQADVAMARFALLQENPDTADAYIQLNSLPQILNSLANLLDDNQRDIVTSMEQRYELALGELEEDPATALSDLKVLYDRLVELENSLFSDP